MNSMQSASHVSMYYYPLLFLGVMAFIMLALGIKVSNKNVFAGITFGSVLVSMALILLNPYDGVQVGSLVFNTFTIFFVVILIISVLYVTFPMIRGIKTKPEIFYSTLIFVLIGMIIATLSYNLIIIFVAFEAVSIGTYVISAYGKEKRHLEASTKYFFTGTIGTAFTVFGLSFFYTATGTFTLTTEVVSSSPAMLVALLFLVIGFGFKLAIFPMHQWAIDAYDGTENGVSAFLSTGTKLLAFMILLKVLLVGFVSDFHDVYILFVILSIFSMTYANLAALSQNNLKRLLAYSSVAQAGYLILVIALVGSAGIGNVAYVAVTAGMFYSLVYIFMKGGSFLAMNLVKKQSVEVSDMSGLAKKSPATAISFAILLMGLAGIPFTGGFTAKYYLFLSLIEGNLWWLAVIAILNSAISVFYYFRVIMFMFWKDPVEDGNFNLNVYSKIPVIVSAVIMVALFFFFYLLPTFATYAPGLFATMGGSI
ncbi:MAG: NADH-quinone oxidoreductase subunit NuoN [Thermoplasmataceae archaeon]